MKKPGLISLFVLFLFGNCQKEEQTGLNPQALEEQLAEHIRSVEPLSPEEQKAAFLLPPGFEIEVFASEPNIGKPMNMSFDAKGRMWLTQSNEYPFPDSTSNSKDRISILEDRDGDGKADQFTVFADALNIPIGITTVPDGAIAYSIPHIYHFIDKDGDDKVDERKILYSGFQYKDTHGMINNLVRSWDGWIHADHGFANNSRVAGSDGDTIVLNSGNTFRFKADGSRIEFTTTGRVNPYGYAYDDWGYTYSVDCHSSPIYQLVRGADYPHFGKKPTGIGFGPALMSHNYGSTALAGLEYYLGDQFPSEYQQSFYLGDVVKSRVYRSTISMEGTTPVVKWEDDFIVSKDPWFRPVDVKLGPDGALYIADFYNRIIGHYEVPLDHPGRDRQRGRIWRITYKGNKSKTNSDWSKAPIEQLFENLDHHNFPLRMLIADQIVDRFGTEAITPLKKLLNTELGNDKKYIQTLWALFRLDALEKQELKAALAHESPYVQVHTLRILFELQQVEEEVLQAGTAKINSPNPHIQRQAVMLMGKHPNREHVRPLLSLDKLVSEKDSHLKYSIKQSLRDQLRDPSVLEWTAQEEWASEEHQLIASALLGVDNSLAAFELFEYLKQNEEPAEQVSLYFKHAARHIAPQFHKDLIKLAREKSALKPNLAFKLYNNIIEGAAQGNKKIDKAAKDWGLQLAQNFLTKNPNANTYWSVIPNLHRPYPHNPWQLEEGILASGPRNNTGGFVSDIQSPGFILGPTISFELSGRKNPLPKNETALEPANKIELRLASNDSLIKVAEITAVEHQESIKWETLSFEGQPAYLLIKDGSGVWGDYIGISQLRGTSIVLPEKSPQQKAAQQIFAAQFAKDQQASILSSPLSLIFVDRNEDIYARAKAAESLLQLSPNYLKNKLPALLASEQEAPLFKEKLLGLISSVQQEAFIKLSAQHLEDLRDQEQKKLILQLAKSDLGRSELLKTAIAKKLSLRILKDQEVHDNFISQLKGKEQQSILALTKDLLSPDESIPQLIEERLAAYNKEQHSIATGRQIFNQHCASCHQIKGNGNNVGPQLDGIGNWGSRALTEKIIDPNRNISKAFKNYIIELKDGSSRGGLFRREEGAVSVFADAAGQEFSIPKDQIAKQELSPYTLMPNYFGELIPEKDYFNLLAFLLNER